MKRIISILFLAALLSPVLAGCQDGLSPAVSEGSVGIRARKVSSDLSIATPMGGPATKSSYSAAAGEGGVVNWTLFQFDAAGGHLVKTYYQDSGSDISNVEVVTGRPYLFYAVANVGNVTNLVSLNSTTVSSMASLSLEVGACSQMAGLPMSWKSPEPIAFSRQDLNDGATLDIEMKRLVSKYSVTLDCSHLSLFSFTLTELQLKGPSTVLPFSDSRGTSAQTATDYASSADIAALNGTSSVTSAPFYAVENLWGTVAGIPTPSAKKPSNVTSDAFPTYIEMTGTATLMDGSGVGLPVKYRFYLGTNNTTNFDVIRNTLNTIEVTLSDQALQDAIDDPDPYGNIWKVVPGDFDKARTLSWQHEATGITVPRQSATGEGVVKTVNASAHEMAFDLSLSSGLLASGAKVYTAPTLSGDVTPGSVSEKKRIGEGVSALYFWFPSAAAGTAAGTATITSLDGRLSSTLAVRVAHFDIPAAQRDLLWEWNATGEANGKAVDITSTVPWSITVPENYAVKYAGTTYPAGSTVPGDGNGQIVIWPVDVNNTAVVVSNPVSVVPESLPSVVVTARLNYRPYVLIERENQAQWDFTDGGAKGLEWEYGQSSGSAAKTFVVRSKGEWTVTAPAGTHWTVTPAAGGNASSDEQTTTLTVYPASGNEGGADITGSITVTPALYAGGADAVTLRHKWIGAYLNLKSGQSNALAWAWSESAGRTITFETNQPWSASMGGTDASWWTLSSTGGSAPANGQVTITVTPTSANPDPSAKSAGVTISSTGVTLDPIAVTTAHAKHPELGLNANDGTAWDSNASGSGSAKTFSVTGDVAWTVSLVEADNCSESDWYLSTTSGTGSATITVYPLSGNVATAARTITLAVSPVNASDGVTQKTADLTQGAGEPYLDIDGAASDFNGTWHWYQGGSGDAVYVTVASNATWTPSYDGSTSSFSYSWDGANSRFVLYPLAANDGSARSMTVTLIADGYPGLTRTISLSQTRRPAISLGNSGIFHWGWNVTGQMSTPVTIDADPYDTASTSYTWSAALSGGDASSFTLDTESGSSGGNVSVTRSSQNGATSDLSTTLVVTMVGDHGSQALPSVEATVKQDKAITVVSTSYRNLNVSISASPSSVPASGGSSTLTYSATWEYRYNYSDSSVGEWTADSGTPDITGSATGFSRSGASVTVSENPNYSSRNVTYTATYTLPDNSSNSSSVTITQAAKEKYVVSTSYRNLNVWISASPISVGASGGSSTLSYGATWEYRYNYSDSSVGSWTSDSGTPDITGSAAGFSRNGSSVTISENPNYSSRNVTYTATYTLPDNTSSSAQATITQAAKEKYIVSTSYRNLNVWISASPTSIGASGGSSTLSYGASWEYRYNYSDSSVGSWTADSGTPGISGSATGFSRSGASVTVAENPNYSARSVTYTATYTLPDNTSSSAQATITQAAKEKYVVSTSYRNLNVWISASPTSIGASGGSSTLSYGASWEYRYNYSDSSVGSWTADSGTPGISGSATGFSRSGASVTVAENPNYSARSVTYTATYTLPDNTSSSAQATITQAAKEKYIVSTSYRNLNVWISASPTSIGASGGSSTLSYGASWEYRYNYSDSSVGDWTSDSGTPDITGSAAGFSRNGVSVTVAENPNYSSRNVTYTATYTLPDNTSSSESTTITQDPKPLNTYTAAYTEVKIVNGSSSIYVGETTQVVAKRYTGSYTGTATSAPTDKSSYTWDGGTSISASSSNIGVATVNGTGSVTVTGAGPGTATITGGTPTGYDRTFAPTTVFITVNPLNTYTAAYTEVTLASGYGSSIDVGETTQVVAKRYTGSYTGTATSAPTDKSSYVWDSGTNISVSSNNASIATVSGTGSVTVTGIYNGEATISGGTPSGYNRTFDPITLNVTVHKVLTSISLSGFPTSTMLIGGSFTPSVTAHFNGAPDETVTGSVIWSNYANTLSLSGTRFTATGGGTTSVTASYTYRGVTETASQSVTVESHRWAISIQRVSNSSIKVFAEYDNDVQDITGSVLVHSKTNVTIEQSSERIEVTTMSDDTGSFVLRHKWLLPSHTEEYTVRVTRTNGYTYIIVP